jgi:ATP-dependent Clp protease protease subunit
LIDGIAAGISSVIAMAGIEIFMTPKSYIVIKNPWGYSSDKNAYSVDILNSIKSRIIDIYMTRNLSIQREDISKMMDEETYINANEALSYRFIDKIID